MISIVELFVFIKSIFVIILMFAIFIGSSDLASLFSSVFNRFV